MIIDPKDHKALEAKLLKILAKCRAAYPEFITFREADDLDCSDEDLIRMGYVHQTQDGWMKRASVGSLAAMGLAQLISENLSCLQFHDSSWAARMHFILTEIANDWPEEML